jgi:drug/metabolite transporter (DMT)-like permease
VLFKIGASGQTTLVGFLNGWNCAGALAYAFGTALWIYALSKAPLTAVYPFTALTFVFVFAAGAFFFDEAVSLASIGGVLLILLGLFLTTR